jgi:hypothetical protein
MGVTIELLVLAAVLAAAPVVQGGPVFALYILAVELLATYLIHCPAHYLVGRALGIRFTRIRAGRTTLARALPPRLGRLARFLPVLTLSTEKSSLASVSRPRVSIMYASGTIASCASAILVAAAVTPSGPWTLVGLSWAVAVGYLLFDLVFSPRGGDLMRARGATRP